MIDGWKGSLAMLLLFAAGCGGRAARVTALPPATVAATPHLSVMTYNVNFGMAGDPATVDAVAQDDADVIFLQETTPQWEAALRARLAEAYPDMAFKQHPPAGGLAVLSKWPIESIDYLPPRSWFPAARVVLQTAVGKVQVLNVHLRPPASDRGNVVSGYFSTPPIRREEISTFAVALDPDLPTLIVGDFNEDERGRAVNWLAEHGYRSALPQFAPHAKTWRWKTSVGTLRGRYDHLCYDARLTPLRVEVRSAGRSDHLPVVGVFALSRDVPLPATQRSTRQ
jgi:endonuclease/exonuclease/phosphatase (EEP) superfamily protein YafD